ncbi:uncharacterized protein C8A04DRAFT_39007 [Dichotomopilus funicola]|uniref:Uncharacterized protein n=1 Tax=Dichotomopilus funicola TaxID=1934379 RepID=A0AAN6ZLF8_9PEZI|nr:hypothetical protein C8A04DRAFT_39007 [Dichotomopilus funicola]
MGSPSLAHTYRTAMRRHRFGYALYEPAPFARLRPGMLGYLDDEYQRWHPILDLTDPAVVQAAGYGPLRPVQRSPPDTRRYGPLTADKVTETSVEMNAGVGAGAVGLPVDVGGLVRYSTAGGFGAVLLCGDEVVSEGFDFRDPFSLWLQRHAKLLFARYPDAKRHGLCAVTWTYSSTDVGIATWENSEGSVTVGTHVGAAGVAKFGPEVSWVRGASSSGWSTWKDQKRVVFFAGVKIKSGLFGSLREEPEKNWRSAGDAFVVQDGENAPYTVSVEQFGDDWYHIRKAGEGDEEKEQVGDDKENLSASGT